MPDPTFVQKESNLVGGAVRYVQSEFTAAELGVEALSNVDEC